MLYFWLFQDNYTEKINIQMTFNLVLSSIQRVESALNRIESALRVESPQRQLIF